VGDLKYWECTINQYKRSSTKTFLDTSHSYIKLLQTKIADLQKFIDDGTIISVFKKTTFHLEFNLFFMDATKVEFGWLKFMSPFFTGLQ
jgi:hypothetical protein